MDDALLERLAELEHEQWMAWSQSVATEVSAKRRRRWQACWVAYQDLPEAVKELDRQWARKVVETLQRS
jgi:hypothetical protein